MRCKIGLQDGFPTAFAVKEPKDMDGLCSFIDLIKGQVALHRHKPDAKAGQKWVTDNGKASEIGKRGFYMNDIREFLSRRPLLFDGGMGTYYKAAPGIECERANQTDPAGVQAEIGRASCRERV